MAQNRWQMRKGTRRRDKNKKANYGAKLFFEVKRYDGDGNLIETVSPDDLMARPIGATRKYGNIHQKRCRAVRLQRTNGEGPMEEYKKIATKVKITNKAAIHLLFSLSFFTEE